MNTIFEAHAVTSDDSQRTSPTLLQQVEAKDSNAWEVFVRLYSPLIFSWCRNSGLQATDVADIQQDVFQVVAVNIESYQQGRKPSGGFRSWLWGITRLEILDHLRSLKRQPVGEGGEHAQQAEWLSQLEDEPVREGDPTSQELLLQSAVAILEPEFDPRTWRAFWDMTVKGRSTKEVGHELKMTANAVRQAKLRVARKLRQLLDDDFAGLLGTAGTE